MSDHPLTTVSAARADREWTTPRRWYSATLTSQTLTWVRRAFWGAADQAGELAWQVDGEPAPQVGPAAVEQDVACAVIAVRRAPPARGTNDAESPQGAGQARMARRALSLPGESEAVEEQRNLAKPEEVGLRRILRTATQ